RRRFRLRLDFTRLFSECRCNAAAQPVHARNFPFMAHEPPDPEVLFHLAPQGRVLAQSSQQQFAFVLRQFTVHKSGYLHFQCIIHKSPARVRPPIVIAPTVVLIPAESGCSARATSCMDRSVISVVDVNRRSILSSCRLVSYPIPAYLNPPG